jgi:hypothetical protein
MSSDQEICNGEPSESVWAYWVWHSEKARIGGDGERQSNRENVRAKMSKQSKNNAGGVDLGYEGVDLASP